MLSQETINKLKANWYTFEQIEWIKLWLEESNAWKVITKEEMEKFVKTELFSKYMENV